MQGVLWALGTVRQMVDELNSIKLTNLKTIQNNQNVHPRLERKPHIDELKIPSLYG